jgi:7-cyano-7-deazaguanine synthase
MSEVLLLSGGIDSIAIAAWRRPAYCLTVDYGQIPAASEIAASSSVCKALELDHEVLRVPIAQLGAGVLAGRPGSTASPNPEFWPYRNQLLVTLAAMIAIERHYAKVLIGTVASDKRHADGSEDFVLCLNSLLEMQEGGVTLEAPAIKLSSLELVRESRIDLSILAWAHSCHSSNVACGHCPGCAKHSEVMQSIGWNR